MNVVSPKRILIVEQDPTIAANVAVAMESLSFKTTISTSPDEAVDLVSRADRFDLIVLDEDFDGQFGGVDLAQRVLETISIPIIYLVGSDPSGAYKRVTHAGSYGFLDRDFGQASLQSAVVVALELFDARRDIDARTGEHRENDARFRRMFDEAPIGAAIVSLDARYQVVNGALCAMLGYSADELTSLSVADVTHPDDLDAIASFGRRLRDGEIDHYELEKRYCRRDGSMMWARLNVRLIRDDSGKALYYFPTMEDITERKKTDIALRESEEILRSFVEQSGEGIVILERDGMIIQWNRAMESITGISREDAIGRPVWEVQVRLMTSEAREGLGLGTLKRLTRRLLQRGDAELIRRPFDTVIQTAGGERRHIQQVAFPVRSGETLRIGSVIRDVTVQKNAEAELTRAKLAAEDSNRAKSALLNNLSHEFRTPINGILGLADLLLEDQLDPTMRELVEGITTSGRRLYYTLDSILKLALFRSGEVATHPVVVPLDRPIRRIIDRYRSQAERRGITLQYECGIDTPAVLGDEEILADILAYLVDNAVKFTKHGSVTVVPSSAEDIAVGRSNIQVRDTGIGIAAEHMETIFQEFKQASEGRSREFEGCGIGLTVAKQMAQVLGGDITVSSEVGKGSTFTLWLRSPAQTSIEQRSLRNVNSRPQKEHGTGLPEVLIVEDNFINTTVIAEFLKHMCRTDHARDGSTAIQMAGKKKYAAILMDINLGSGPDGIETTKEIRQIHGYQSTPIVAVTGYSLPGDGDRLISQGLTMYLPKPFDRSEIVNIVRRALS